MKRAERQIVATNAEKLKQLIYDGELSPDFLEQLVSGQPFVLSVPVDPAPEAPVNEASAEPQPQPIPLVLPEYRAAARDWTAQHIHDSLLASPHVRRVGIPVHDPGPLGGAPLKLVASIDTPHGPRRVIINVYGNGVMAGDDQR